MSSANASSSSKSTSSLPSCNNSVANHAVTFSSSSYSGPSTSTANGASFRDCHHRDATCYRPRPPSASRPLDGSMHFSISDYPKEALDTMNIFRNMKKFCDVVIHAGEESFHCHKVVLASCSPYFKAMFCSGLKETDKPEVTIHGINPDIMCILINFAYTAELSVSEMNVCNLLPASCMFQMTHAVEACCTFLEHQLDPSNSIGIAEFAEQHGCHELAKKAKDYIDLYFSEVVKHDEFMNLHPCKLVTLLKRDELNVKCESEVYNAVKAWVRYDEKHRLSKLENLLCVVRCHFLTPKFLRDQLDFCRILKNNPQCKEYLCRILTDLELHKPCPDQQRYPQGAMVIYVVGGYLRQSLSNMECFHPELQQWFTLADLPMPRSGLGVGVVEGMLYAVGGRNNSPDGNMDTAAVERFDYLHNEWEHCAPLTVPRNRVGVCVLDNMLYAVGGSHGSAHHASVERYNPADDKWTLVKPMKTKRIGVGAAVVNRLLYAVGGYDGTNRLSTVECYHPENDEWNYVASMNVHRSGAGVTALGLYLYAVGGYDGTSQLKSVERYDIVRDRWETVPPMNSPRSALSVSVIDNKLYALGGYDGHNFLNTVEMYDPEARVWTEVTNMGCGRSGHAAASWLGVFFKT